MKERAVTLVFRPEAARMNVRLEAANLAPEPLDLVLRLNGTRIASVHLDAASGRRSVAIPFAAGGSRAELTLEVGATQRPGALVFFRLQVVDE
jgi:hypothetical protein